MQKYPDTCWHVVQLWVLVKGIDYTQLATFCKDQPQTWYKMVEVSKMTQNKIGRLKHIITQGSRCNIQHREASFNSQIVHKPFACMSYMTPMPAHHQHDSTDMSNDPAMFSWCHGIWNQLTCFTNHQCHELYKAVLGRWALNSPLQ